MKKAINVTRRELLKVGAAGAAVMAAPGYLRRAWASGPIRVGMPASLTGSFTLLGQQTKRGCEYYINEVNRKGGILGRPVELIQADSTGNPATCVRKTRELVERDNCRIITGITLSSEALAVVPLLAQWDTLFVSSLNGDGSLTANNFVPNFFRANMSGPMSTRVVSLAIAKSSMKSLYLIGMDFAWGHDTAKVFEQEMKAAGKSLAGVVFAPIGTKDFSSYIVKIRQSGADGLMVALAGDDLNAFLAQADQYQLNKKMRILMEQVVVESLSVLGKAAVGITGCSRYTPAYDYPINTAFVKGFQQVYGHIPDMFEGEAYHAMELIGAGIQKAGTTDTDALRQAMATLTFDGVKGPVTVRACDHQAEQQGFLSQLEERDGIGLYPRIEAIFPASEVVPTCNSSVFPT